MSRLIVTMQDLRTIPGLTRRGGLCAPSSRAWAKRNGLDFRAFVRDGIDAEVLLATGDGFALKLVDWARQRREAGRGQE